MNGIIDCVDGCSVNMLKNIIDKFYHQGRFHI